METRIIHTSDIFPCLEQELKSVSNDLTIVSAFVKLSALIQIDRKLKKSNITKRLLVRFRKEDILFGSSDLEIFNYCQKNNWKLYYNLDLHSKIFVFDRVNYIVGSANVTLSGLGISNKSNIETVCYGKIKFDEMDKIDQFFLGSSYLTEAIYILMNEQIENNTNNSIRWNSEIIERNVPPTQLWVSEMISSLSPFDMNSADRALLELDLQGSFDMHNVKEKFLQTKCYRWMRHIIKDEIYFGELSAKLHDSLIDDPGPYRKDVKQLLSNLLNWITELNIDEVFIDQPHFSKRIRKAF